MHCGRVASVVTQTSAVTLTRRYEDPGLKPGNDFAFLCSGGFRPSPHSACISKRPNQRRNTLEKWNESSRLKPSVAWQDSATLLPDSSRALVFPL
ncbi:hypothetical protein EYF80_040353 [Liparis tanakae]|uniref:Uncharacterized protein n=1 Tax=Liparis tanakae TaxID=230148 RepID=A0A4Z2G7B4_9TELE|nr:hypothetical protein EYF80_040353 [Liparis tanakae]